MNRNPSGPRHVCMIAYANYYTDARIKNYVGALLRRGDRVDVFALGGKSAVMPEGVRLYSLMEKHWGKRALGYVASQIVFACVATIVVGWHYLRCRYPLVHVHNMPDFIVFSALIPRLGGARIILDVHDTMPETFATKFNVELSHPLIRMMVWEERISAWFADRVITTNELHKQVLCSHGIAAEKITVILNVGDNNIFQPMPRQRRPVDGLVLVYHGTVAERLGLDLIVRALDAARNECPNLKFLLIGEGDSLPDVRALVKERGLTDLVEFMGFIPVEDLPRYLSQADVGIVGIREYYQTKKNYGLPVKMLEYAAMEIPTIAPRLRVVSHYFDEESALFYTPDDIEDMARRIREVSRDRTQIDRVRQRLRQFNHRYNWPVMERRYLDLIEDLLDSQTHALWGGA